MKGKWKVGMAFTTFYPNIIFSLDLQSPPGKILFKNALKIRRFFLLKNKVFFLVGKIVRCLNVQKFCFESKKKSERRKSMCTKPACLQNSLPSRSFWTHKKKSLFSSLKIFPKVYYGIKVFFLLQDLVTFCGPKFFFVPQKWLNSAEKKTLNTIIDLTPPPPPQGKIDDFPLEVGNMDSQLITTRSGHFPYQNLLNGHFPNIQMSQTPIYNILQKDMEFKLGVFVSQRIYCWKKINVFCKGYTAKKQICFLTVNSL